MDVELKKDDDDDEVIFLGEPEAAPASSSK